MSTKITKGARLHLLRVVERLQYPMFILRAPRATERQRRLFAEAIRRHYRGRSALILPAGVTFQFITPIVSP